MPNISTVTGVKSEKILHAWHVLNRTDPSIGWLYQRAHFKTLYQMKRLYEKIGWYRVWNKLAPYNTIESWKFLWKFGTRACTSEPSQETYFRVRQRPTNSWYGHGWPRANWHTGPLATRTCGSIRISPKAASARSESMRIFFFKNHTKLTW